MRALGFGRAQLCRSPGDPSSQLALQAGSDIFFGLLWATNLTGCTMWALNVATKCWTHLWRSLQRQQPWPWRLVLPPTTVLSSCALFVWKVISLLRQRCIIASELFCLFRTPCVHGVWLTGDTIPFTDVRAGASWKATVGQDVPWTSKPPLADLTRNGEATFLAKDLFHIVNLGIGRTFLCSAICFLIHLGHFIPSDPDIGRSIPVRINEAYADFKHFVKHIMKTTPHVKHWSRENLGWKGPRDMPQVSFKASDTYLILSWLVDYLGRPFQANNYINNMLACAHGVLLMLSVDCSLLVVLLRHVHSNPCCPC